MCLQLPRPEKTYQVCCLVQKLQTVEQSPSKQGWRRSHLFSHCSLPSGKGNLHLQMLRSLQRLLEEGVTSQWTEERSPSVTGKGRSAIVFCGWGGRQRRSKEPGTWPHLPLDHVTSPAAALTATPWPLLSGGFTTPSCLLCLLHTSVDIGGHLNIFIWLWSQPSWNKEWWQREWEIVRLSRSCISVCLSSYAHIFKWTWDWETICFLRTCEESQLKKSISTTFQSVEKWVKWAETFMLSVPLHVVSSGGPEALVR